ncbi:MAG: cysteine desulfurase [Rhizobiales bacterium 62-47]|nr:cysteine desulfurase [Hyphomicrobiales bacterium]OJY10037.1 MAG: cysteine desulfurase [Rhizobiales bacterium 62-47]
MATRTYLDWNATTPLRPEARDAMIAALEICGNPSSVHAEGRRSRMLVEHARLAVANAVGATPQQVIFTSGGTEANVLALQPELRGSVSPPHRRLLVSAIEHASVLTGGHFSEKQVDIIPVTRSGLVDLDDLRSRLDGQPPTLVSVMLANNETGAIQPIAAIADIVHQAEGLLHVDAVQAFGKIATNIKELKGDLLTISAHKVGGPKGVGALILGENLAGFTALLRGGGQEKGRRAGTENVPGIAGFGSAVTATMANLSRDREHMSRLRQRLEAGIKEVPDAIIFCADLPRLPNTTLFTVPGLRAETAIIGFDLEGIALSSGSACSSGKVTPSHVLTAMGLSAEVARGGIRVSLGWSTSDGDVDRFIQAWRKLAGTLLKNDDETVLERF